MKTAFFFFSFTVAVFSYAPWLHPEDILAYNNDYIADVTYSPDFSDSSELVLERDSITKSNIWHGEYQGEIIRRYHATIYGIDGNWQKNFLISYEDDSINGDTTMESELILKNDTMQIVYKYSADGDTTVFFQKYVNARIISSIDTGSTSYSRYIYDNNGYLDSMQTYNPINDSVEYFRWYDFENGKLMQYGISGNPEDYDETSRVMIYEGDKLTGSIHLNAQDTTMISRYRYKDDGNSITYFNGVKKKSTFSITCGNEIEVNGDDLRNIKIFNAKGSLLFIYNNSSNSKHVKFKNNLPKGLFFISIDNTQLKLINR